MAAARRQFLTFSGSEPASTSFSLHWCQHEDLIGNSTEELELVYGMRFSNWGNGAQWLGSESVSIEKKYTPFPTTPPRVIIYCMLLSFHKTSPSEITVQPRICACPFHFQRRRQCFRLFVHPVKFEFRCHPLLPRRRISPLRDCLSGKDLFCLSFAVWSEIL